MDTSKLENGKYHSGKFTDLGEYRGWFVGSFFKDENHPCKTDQLEVMYMQHEAGEIFAKHYHKLKVELIVVLDGKARYTVNGNDVILSGGDFLFVDVNNIISAEFLEPTKIFAIHSPSIITDKTVV